MTNDAMLVAVATAIGWNHVHYAKDLSESIGSPVFRGRPPGKDYYDNVPNFPECLNAMATAEKWLQDQPENTYSKNSIYTYDQCLHRWFGPRADARSRAYVFLDILELYIP